MTSLWLDEPQEQRTAHPHDGRVDVAIVGGGVTGCTCALVAARGGLRVRLFEAREIATGASGRNGGFALRGGAMPYDEARATIGADQAALLWRLTERALDHLEELAGDALRRCGSLRLAADDEERGQLVAEYNALRADGFAVEWIDELDGRLAAMYRGAIRHPGDGALHPGRWVRRLAGLAATAGAEIVEGRHVASLDELDAENVVIATDGYTAGLLPELDEAVKPTRGQVVATEPLAERLFDCPHYARHGFDYWQQLDDLRLVLGGRRDTRLEDERTAEEEVTEPIQSALERFAEELLGAPPAITHRWAGIFGVTADLLPLVGPVPGHDGVWVAAGYSGHGNVLGLACGELVAQAILGRPAPELELFDPARIL